MTSIYLIRHAQSHGNLGQRIQGRIDTPLTEMGLKQAEELQMRFTAMPLNAVYSSPLIRAMQTGRAIAQKHEIIMEIEPELTEMSAGVIENMPFFTMLERYPEEFRQFDQEPHRFKGFEGAESVREVYERVVSAIERIAARHPNQNVAVVSHGFPIRCYLCHARAGSIEQLGKIPWSKNASVSHIMHSGGKATVLRENDLSHLPGELISPDWKVER